MGFILTGIKHVLVALMAQKAEIKYDPEYILSNQIANRVNDLGFHATVIESETVGKGTVELLVSKIKVKSNNGLHYILCYILNIQKV